MILNWFVIFTAAHNKIVWTGCHGVAIFFSSSSSCFGWFDRGHAWCAMQSVHIARMHIGGIWPVSVQNVLHASVHTHTYHSMASSFNVCSLSSHSSLMRQLWHLLVHRTRTYYIWSLTDWMTAKHIKVVFFLFLLLNHVQNDNRKILRDIGMGCVVVVVLSIIEFSLFAAIISITDHFRFPPEELEL